MNWKVNVSKTVQHIVAERKMHVGTELSSGWNSLHEHLYRIWGGSLKAKVGDAYTGGGEQQIWTDKLVMAN